MLFCAVARQRECGATLVEYAVLVGLIAVAAIVLLVLIGSEVRDAFQAVTDVINENTP
jgi:Flp pilus assembly pilin Flp